MDQGIKRLLQARPADVLALALPGIEYLEPMPTQVATEPRLELDTLFRARYEGHECAINIEAQAYADPDMPRRCFKYGARASIIHDLPVLSVVLWLERHGAIPTAPYEMRVGSWKQATWEIIHVEVYELAAQDAIASGSLGLLPLVPFMRGGDEPTIERAAVSIRDTAPPGELAGDLAALLAVFMARFHGEEAARAMIGRVFVSTQLLNESPLYRSWRAEAEAEGRAEGRAEGESEGRVKGLRIAARTALEGRFGALDDELVALIDIADEARLTVVLAHIAADTLDQVRERLRPA